MRKIYRLKIIDNDPVFMDEDEMLEDVYDELYEVKERIEHLVRIIENSDDDETVKF